MNITCVGGGPAGLYFAILGRRLDPAASITVYDRYPPGVTYGWGVTLSDDLLDDLDARDEPTGRAVRAAAFRWEGQTVAVGDRAPVRAPGHGFGMSRQVLLEILAARATELGVDVRHDTELGEDDERLRGADLVIAADGVHSRLRRRHAADLGTTVVRGRNKFVWLGTDRVFDAFTFRFVPTDAGWIWAYGYGFDAGMSTVIVETSPETWAGLGFDRMGAAEALQALEELFAVELRGCALRLPAGSGDRLPWAEFQTVTNSRWHAGNVVLAGDAAHTAHFSIGWGTLLAFDDAIALAEAVTGGGDLQQVLADYGRRRGKAVAEAQAIAANSRRWFENLPRYVDRDPDELTRLLFLRRSSVLQRVPPAAYLRLSQVSTSVPALKPVRGAVRQGLRLARQASVAGGRR